MKEERESFPEDIISPEEVTSWQKGPLKEGGIKERLRNAASGAMGAFSPRRQIEKIRASTPEDPNKRRKIAEGKRGKKGEVVAKEDGEKAKDEGERGGGETKEGKREDGE